MADDVGPTTLTPSRLAARWANPMAVFDDAEHGGGGQHALGWVMAVGLAVGGDEDESAVDGADGDGLVADVAVKEGHVGAVALANDLEVGLNFGLHEHGSPMLEITDVLDGHQAFLGEGFDEAQQSLVLYNFVVGRDSAETTVVVVTNHCDLLRPLNGLTVRASKEQRTLGDGPVEVVGNSESRHVVCELFVLDLVYLVFGLRNQALCHLVD